jgi:hypothetical protein
MLRGLRRMRLIAVLIIHVLLLLYSRILDLIWLIRMRDI